MVACVSHQKMSTANKLGSYGSWNRGNLIRCSAETNIDCYISRVHIFIISVYTAYFPMSYVYNVYVLLRVILKVSYKFWFFFNWKNTFILLFLACAAAQDWAYNDCIVITWQPSHHFFFHLLSFQFNVLISHFFHTENHALVIILKVWSSLIFLCIVINIQMNVYDLMEKVFLLSFYKRKQQARDE